MSAKKGVAPTRSREAEVTPPVDGERRRRKRRVLIVDDSATACKQIQIFLEADQTIAVDTACNGSEALEALGERPYSVVVTDLKMPRLDGLQLLARGAEETAAGRRDHHDGIRHGG